MPGTVFLALASILQNHLGAAGFVKRMVIAPLIAFPVNAVVNLALTDELGISGAALAATISYAVLLLVAGILVWQSERHSLARSDS
jgi:Na+-driven multidrug efflux pump